MRVQRILVVAALLASTACSDPSNANQSPVDPLGDAVTPSDPGPTPTDPGPTPVDPGPTPTDPGPPADPGPPPDLIPDKDPPTVTKVTPGEGTFGVSVPFTITIVFSEPVKNVEKNTVTLTDVNNDPIEGTFAAEDDGKTHTFTPKAEDLLYASPYTLTVNYPTQVILDAAGNKMAGLHETHFFTTPPGDLGKYDNLAMIYAPNLRIAAESAYPIKGNIEIPTRLNLDGDWDAKDNPAYLSDDKTKQLKPAVHYAVLESESHYYVHYVYYWARRENLFDGEEELSTENDTAGALVVVEKWPVEKPVEVLTWFKLGPHEYIRAFPTAESGILDGDKDNQAVDETFPAETLFLNSRFQAFVSAGRHHSCLWNDDGQDYLFLTTCSLPPGEKEFYNVYELSPAATPGILTKNGATWPENGVLGYELVDLLVEWWPRRTQYDTLFHDSTSVYSVKVEDKTWAAKFPRNFLDSQGDQGDGRVPWAVIWKPADGKPYTENLAQGMFFVDPPKYLQERHGSAYFSAEFSADTKAGFSGRWCFNPYLGIDIRGTGDVCP